MFPSPATAGRGAAGARRAPRGGGRAPGAGGARGRSPYAPPGVVPPPGPGPAPVDPELLEAGVQAARELVRLAVRVAEHDHPDGAGLAPGRGRKGDAAYASNGVAERSDDRRQLARRATAEEGERHVEVLPRNTTASQDVLLLPALDEVARRLGQPERKEEP